MDRSQQQCKVCWFSELTFSIIRVELCFQPYEQGEIYPTEKLQVEDRNKKIKVDR